MLLIAYPSASRGECAHPADSIDTYRRSSYTHRRKNTIFSLEEERVKAGFQYFPDNFMWSQGMMIVIEMARWGAAAMSEVDRVGKRLRDRVGETKNPQDIHRR